MTIAEIVCWGVFLLADSGYQGIQEYHENSEIPIKKPRGGELTADEKSHNRELSRRRVPIEWVNARIKTFKMMSVPFRNRRTTHLARMTLICGIINANNGL
jgi:hypothetical protein